MKLLYLFNLFIVCSSSFIIQPAYLPIKYNHLNIHGNVNVKKQIYYNNLIELRKPSININLKKNNEDNDDDIEIKLAIRLVYNIILYSSIILYSYIYSHN